MDGAVALDEAGREPLALEPGDRAVSLMMAAVDAVLASTQVAAATVTVRQRPVAGSPVSGSIR